MSEYAMAAHRDGDRVAVETMVKDHDYQGVVNTSYLDADAAIRFGEAVAALGRQIKRDADPLAENTYSE